jgi:hypothetical protein
VSIDVAENLFEKIFGNEKIVTEPVIEAVS